MRLLHFPALAVLCVATLAAARPPASPPAATTNALAIATAPPPAAGSAFVVAAVPALVPVSNPAVPAPSASAMDTTAPARAGSPSGAALAAPRALGRPPTMAGPGRRYAAHFTPTGPNARYCPRCRAAAARMLSRLETLAGSAARDRHLRWRG